MKTLQALAIVSICLTATAVRSDDSDRPPSVAGVVATVHPAATQAGQNVYRNGGNAVDAAVAAALTLGVVDCHNSGIGGGCFILLRLPDGRLVAIDGRETAPAAAHRDMYLRDGKPQRLLSRTGPLAVGTPGALAAYEFAVKRFGKRLFAELIRPAADIAEQGFAIDQTFADRLKTQAADLARFEGSRAALLDSDGQPYRHGQKLRIKDLAATYRAIARDGTDWFYQGPFAKRVSDWMDRHDGILAREDFANYRVKVREPIVTTYRGYTIVGFPPPSSGGIHVAQILNILEAFDLADVGSTRFAHLSTEAMKLAFADRAHWLGDADFAKVPKGLIDKRYARQLRDKHIQPDRATRILGHGTPADWQSDVFGKHTTHIAAADQQGYWVAITSTNNTPFGSKVIVPGTGVVLNNQMDDFSIQPGVPNAFGLIGAEANSIAPGKRPLSSMSPTIVLKDGKPVMTLGAAGGPRIISQVALTIVRTIDRGKSLEQAVAAPRFHHQWHPDRLFVEATNGKMKLPPDVVKALRKQGHRVEPMPYAGVTQAVGLDKDGKTLIAIEDPRVPREYLKPE